MFTAQHPADQGGSPASPPQAPPKPLLLTVKPDTIPVFLRELSNWVGMRLELRSGGYAKVPKTPAGRNADPTNRATWSTFDKVMAAYRAGGLDGIGFVLDGHPVTDDGLAIAGVDLDKVDASPEAAARADEIVRRLNTYTERSPSGRGLRMFCLARPLQTGVARDGVEFYTSGRYLTVTGHVVGGWNE